MVTISQIRPYLVAGDEQLSQHFRELQSRSDVARLLEVSPYTLRRILYGARERKQYVERLIPKKHEGDRRICIPPKNIRILQDKLLRVLSLVYSPRPCVTGFVINRCTLDNAKAHAGKNFILNFDLSDFFPSIHLGRVRAILVAEPFNIGSEAALTIAQIACHDDGHLPQGAPTSPILANMVCGPFDTAMMSLAKKHRCAYTRYADDITISTTQRRFPSPLAQTDDSGACHLGAELVATVAAHNFQIREGKTRLRNSLRRQRVTGLITNEFPNVPRRFIRELRALIHSCVSAGLPAAAERHAQCRGVQIVGEPCAWIREVLRGRLAYVKMIRGSHDFLYRALLRDASRVADLSLPTGHSMADQIGQLIRRRSRRAPNWAIWASRLAPAVFRLKSTMGGEEAFGTAFRVGTTSVVTAGHCALSKNELNDVIRRDLCLTYPIDPEIPVTDVLAATKDWGGIDLAVGSVILPPEWPSATLRTQERIPQIGEEVATIGYPAIASRNVDVVFHIGRIESVQTGYGGARYFSVSFTSGLGLSGAPLIDANGYCLGVMVENAYHRNDQDALRPYGQAIAIGHWREIPNVGTRLFRSVVDR